MQDVPLARAMAERCVRSGSFHGVWIDYFTATTPNNSDIYKMLKEEGISALGFEEVYSRLDNCIAAFLSHYRIWKLAAETNTSVTIFEHDAVIKAPIQPVPFNMCLNLGKPSYGKFNTPQSLGVGPLVSKRYFMDGWKGPTLSYLFTVGRDIPDMFNFTAVTAAPAVPAGP